MMTVGCLIQELQKLNPDIPVLLPGNKEVDRVKFEGNHIEIVAAWYEETRRPLNFRAIDRP